MSKLMEHRNPEDVAKELKENNFSVEKYEQIQLQRATRLQYWNEVGLQELIDREKELIAFGEKVLFLLKQ